MINQEDFYKNAFARNIGILSEQEQKKIGQAKIAIAGLGGVGGVYLLNLARLGVTKFSIADFDKFELPNINRQAGATISSMGNLKAETMERMARDINPFISISNFKEGINEKNIDTFLSGANVVLDGIDFFNIDARILLFKKAREHNVYAATSPPIGFGSSLLVFSPNGMTFEDYFDIKKEDSQEDKLISFAIGLAPSLIQREYFKTNSIDFLNNSAPSLVPGTLLCANLVISETVKIILGKKVKTAPFSSHFDPYVKKYKKIFLWKGNKNLIQRIKIWIVKKYLLKNKGE